MGQCSMLAKVETKDTLSKVFAWASRDFTLESDCQYVLRTQQDYETGKDLSLVGFDRETGKPVIFTGLHDSDDRPGTFQIGFWKRHGAQGARLATESTNALIRYAFNELGARKIVMCHSEFNHTSPKIFADLGFEFEEKREKSLVMAGGKVVDAYWYAMTSPDGLKPMDVRWGEAVPA
jgi:RimJ/RimL family protein N-acetyltransferase